MKHLLTTSLLLFTASVVYAAEASHQQDEGHVIVNDRPMSDPLLAQIQQEREEEALAIKENDYYQLAQPEMGVTCADFCPNCMLKIDCFALTGTMLRMRDGSEWAFDKEDAHIIQSWKKFHEISITPRQPVPWSQTYPYVLINKDLNSSVNANITMGPHKHGSWTTWVYGLNHDGLSANLLSGQGSRTAWEIAPSDLAIFKKWEHNDTIIIGYNNSYLWWLSSYDHILFNVNINQFVRAKLTSTASFKLTTGAN